MLSVFEQKISSYKVCIFVHRGPFGKVAALNKGVLGFIYAL